MRFVVAGFVAIGTFVVVLASLSGRTVQAGEDASKPEFYTTQVKPIMDTNCGRCHLGVNHRGGLNMGTRELLLKGGHSGPAVVPGDPASSLLIKLVRHEGPASEPKNMPPNKPKISDADIQTLTEWIKAGAAMPAVTAQ